MGLIRLWYLGLLVAIAYLIPNGVKKLFYEYFLFVVLMQFVDDWRRF